MIIQVITVRVLNDIPDSGGEEVCLCLAFVTVINVTILRKSNKSQLNFPMLLVKRYKQVRVVR